MSDQPFGRSRRDFMRIAVTAGTTAALPWMQDAHAQSPANSTSTATAAGHSAKGTQLILLGTKGGPTPSDLRAAPANVLVVDGQPYVTAFLGVLGGISEQVYDHLFQTGQVAVDPYGRRRELHGKCVPTLLDQEANRL